MNFDSLGGQYKIGYNLRCKSIISPFKKKKKTHEKEATKLYINLFYSILIFTWKA